MTKKRRRWDDLQLFKYSETVGLPIVCADNGKKAGVIKDIIFNPAEREVKAFLLDRRGLELSKKQVLFKNVQGLGKDALIINNESVLQDYSSKSKGDNAVKSKQKFIDKQRDIDRQKVRDDEGKLIGLHVFEKSGNEIGIVADVEFDTGTGRIESVELSDGLLQDIVQGRRRMPLFGKVEFGDDNMLVEKEAVEEMVNNGRGIKKGLLS